MEGLARREASGWACLLEVFLHGSQLMWSMQKTSDGQRELRDLDFAIGIYQGLDRVLATCAGAREGVSQLLMAKVGGYLLA